MSSKAKGCAAGLLLGSLLKALVTLLGLLTKVIANVLWYTGLWVPGVYALFGFILYLVWHFNPLSGGLYPTLFLVGFGICVVIFLVVFVRNLFVKPFRSVAEGFRNPIWKRKKEDEEEGDNKAGKRRNETEDEDEAVWRKTRMEHRRKQALRRAKRAEAPRLASVAEGDADINVSEDNLTLEYSDDIYGYRKTRKEESERALSASDDWREAEEQPKIYLSAVERDTLIHEYKDRFEVYDLDGGKKTLRTIEYKGERR